MYRPDVFLLDPDYENFEPGLSPLKLSTITGSGTGEIFSVFVFTLLLSGVLLALFVVTEQRHRLFMADGVETTFTIKNCNTITHRGKNSTTYTADIVFDYWTQDTMHTASASMDGTCSGYPVESYVKGMYLAHNTADTLVMSLAQLQQPFFNRQPNFWWGFIFFAGSTLLLLYYARMYIMGRGKRRRLMEEGRLLDGKILSASSAYRNKSRSHYVVINYTFTSPEGEHKTGKQEKHREDLRPGASRQARGCWSLMTGSKEKRKTEDINRLPGYGTSVLVLYADEKNFVLL